MRRCDRVGGVFRTEKPTGPGGHLDTGQGDGEQWEDASNLHSRGSASPSLEDHCSLVEGSVIDMFYFDIQIYDSPYSDLIMI